MDRKLFLILLAGAISCASNGQVVRFQTNLGEIDVQLLPEKAPKTVANFLSYMNAGAYNNSIIHRSVPGFVWQGGGYQLVNNGVQKIPPNAPVPNEFSVSNTRGTLAMALSGTDSNSATTEWFFNEVDNSANLDPKLFTVFGMVTNPAGLAVMDTIAGLPIYSVAGFSQIPLTNYTSGLVMPSNLVVVTSITNVNPPAPPFGSFDTPTNGAANVAGAVGVTGWALSYTAVTSVRIYRDPLPNEPRQANGLVFIGSAEFISGARPDVAAAYPTYPNSTVAGWGLQLLTNELPSTNGLSIGNGTYTLHAIATDTGGTNTDLGTKTITVTNASSSLPFGTIDTPAQGGSASGRAFVNFGWALTPQPNLIPVDGSTITVYIDKVAKGHPVYNNPRADIQMLFPGYQNTNGAVGYYVLDTTQLTNGLHTISWGVADNAGHATGIGSRFFTVQN